MPNILDEMLKELPKDKISEACFEGANIILYTKDRDFFLANTLAIKELVQKFKKRIELRPDPSICIPTEKAKELIEGIIPKEAAIDHIQFDVQRSQVIIEAEKPGLAIGKQGTLLRDIRNQTFWMPLVKRKPAIRSRLIENIRAVLYENSDWRRKFLNKVGHRTYDGWLRGKKEEWIRVTYLGGARQVGRSCLFLQTPESRILLDCGLDVAAQSSNAYPYLDAPELRIDELDAVIVSHAHIDHSGMVPYLFKYGFDGPIYCTAPTRDVMALLQLDMVKLMMNEGREPLYTSDEIKEMVKHTITLDFEEVSDITPDVRLTFYNAGHIIGSAMSHLHIGNGLHNMLYTGDMKYARSLLLEPAHTKFHRLESLMIESTYGGKDNVLPPGSEADDLLRDVIKMTVERRGKVLMPVLGSGRAQDMIVLIESLVRNKVIDPIPVYIDGMVWDITAIHTAYPEYLNTSLRRQIFHQDQNPFLSPIFKHVGSAKERKQVLEEEGSCIVLATSGMLIGGPSVEYLTELAASQRNTLVFSCYQGEGSLGKRILNGEREITLSVDATGKPSVLKINMEVFRLEITDHSDRRQLMNFVGACDPRPKKVLINHGEQSRSIDLASSLHRQYRVETMVPRNLDSIRLR